MERGVGGPVFTGVSEQIAIHGWFRPNDIALVESERRLTWVEYNRRADTSGTQASAQAYFLGLPCTGSNALSIVPAPAVGGSTSR